MNAVGDNGERLEELLVRRAIEGLDPADTAETERLLAAADGVDPDFFDEAAAWFWVAEGDAAGPLPDDVAARALAALEDPDRDARGTRVVPVRRRVRNDRGAATAWLAAAALLVIALAGWWPRLQPGAPADPAAARDELIAAAPDLVRVEWTPTEHPRAQQLGGGYVVWSDALQRGYMTFRRIPGNDPAQHQYQLWVFDATRTDQYPVDGGVFDAGSGGTEVVVPIRTRLPVRRAELFAVTLEPPGGVVVSDRDPILWIARPESGSQS